MARINSRKMRACSLVIGPSLIHHFAGDAIFLLHNEPPDSMRHYGLVLMGHCKTAYTPMSFGVDARAALRVCRVVCPNLDSLSGMSRGCRRGFKHHGGRSCARRRDFSSISIARCTQQIADVISPNGNFSTYFACIWLGLFAI